MNLKTDIYDSIITVATQILEDNIESPYIEEEEDSTKYFAIEPSAPTEAEIEVPSEIAEIEDTIEDVASDNLEYLKYLFNI